MRNSHNHPRRFQLRTLYLSDQSRWLWRPLSQDGPRNNHLLCRTPTYHSIRIHCWLGRESLYRSVEHQRRSLSLREWGCQVDQLRQLSQCVLRCRHRRLFSSVQYPHRELCHDCCSRDCGSARRNLLGQARCIRKWTSVASRRT